MESTSYESCIADPETLVTLLHEKDREIEKLQRLLAQANKRTFGRKSEQTSPNDRQGAIFAFEPVEEPGTQTITVPEHRRAKRRGRLPLPADLPRERIEHMPEVTTCSCCGEDLVRIGEEVTEELDFRPAQFLVKEHVRIKLACRSCKGDGVQSGTLPPSVQPLERTRPGAGLLSHIIIAKYVDHMPLYRQEAAFLRHGVSLSRARMSDWVMKVAELLSPLGRALKREILSHPYVQADETTIKVQDPEREKDGLLTGYLWSLHKPPDLVYFEYFPTRAGEAAKELLDGFKGTVQTDLYAGYNTVIVPGSVCRIACLAHIRRKFIEVQKAAPKECGLVLALIAKLYQCEAKWKHVEHNERTRLRAKHSLPVLSELYRYLTELSARSLPRAPIAEALSYALGQWEAVERIFSDGAFELDNNAIERQIRPIAVGRKNYLFAGSHDGARAAAILYSLLGTAKLHKVNQFEWLADVIVRVQSRTGGSASNLLPHRWRKDA